MDIGIPPETRADVMKTIGLYRKLQSLDSSNELLGYVTVDGDSGRESIIMEDKYLKRFVEPDERIEWLKTMDFSPTNWEVRMKSCERYAAALKSAIDEAEGKSVSPATRKALERQGIGLEATVGFDRVECRPIKAGEIYCVEPDTEEAESD